MARFGRGMPPQPFTTRAAAAGEVLETVSTSVGVVFDTHAPVPVSRGVSFSTAGTIASSRGVAFATRAAVTMSRGALFDTLERTGVTRGMSYTTTASVPAVRQVVYDTLTPVAATRGVSFGTLAPAAVVYHQTFDNGTDGAPVTVGNSADSGDPFSIVNPAGGGAIVYDTGSALRGARGARLTAPAGGQASLRMPVPATPMVSVSVMFRLNTPVTVANATILRLVNNAAGFPASVVLLLAGNLQFRNGANATVKTSPALTVGTVYRLQVQLVKGTTTTDGFLAFQLHDDTGTLVDSYTSSAANTLTGDVTGFDVGKITLPADTFDMGVDELRVMGAADPFGALPQPVSASRSVAFSTLTLAAASRGVVFSTLTGVATSRGVVFGTRAPVTMTRGLVYVTRSGVGSARQVVFATRASVTTSRTVAYAVRTPVATSRVLAYSTRAPVTTSRVIRYDVAGLLLSVVVSRGVVFGTRAQVARNSVVRFDTRSRVAASRPILFDVRSVVTASSVVRFSTYELARVVRSLRFDTLQFAAVDRTILFVTDAIAYVPVDVTAIVDLSRRVVALEVGGRLVRTTHPVRMVLTDELQRTVDTVQLEEVTV